MLKVVPRKIDDLTPYSRNARTHSDAQIAQIMASIVEFSWANPILTDGNNGIIAGHGRLVAARRLRDAGTRIPNWPDPDLVPTIDLAHLTPAQRRAYVLADNKLALNAGWDDAMLALELGDLDAEGFDIDVLGFDPAELDALFADADATPEGNTDPDDVPEPPANPVTVPGDVWVMGRHRIVCGDSTDAGTVAKALNGVIPHLMVTDPPYGVEYDASWRNKAMPETNPGKSGGSRGKVMNDDKADWREAWALFPGDVVYVWHGGNMAHVVAESLIVCGLEIRAQIIWVKHQFVIGRGHYHPHHEPCWYAVRKGATGHWAGDRKQSTVWQIDKPKNSETGHSTQKPIECMKRPIENNSSPGQAVYEPFSGSGTTIIAGEMTGRSVYAVELNPAYVDVAVKRWQDFAGKTATLEGDGRTFDEVCEVRYSGGEWAANCAGSYDDAVAAARERTAG